MLPFRVLLITDVGAAASRARGVIDTLATALAGGDLDDVAVLVRMKHAPIDVVADACAAVRVVARRARARVLVHTHVQLVARLGLDGAHVDSRTHVGEARIALPPRALLGASRHAGDAVDDDRLDYVTLSPIFAPTSKPADTRAPLGVTALRATRTPIVALGGVDAASARACIKAGAAAVAVVGAVMAAHDPRAALLRLLR